MRFVYAIVCLVMILFVGVQYNDPDFYFWMPVYGVTALWSGLAAWAPGRLRLTPARIGVAVCTLAALVGTAWLWPTEAGFWHKEIWWNSETAREGMGMMIVAVALVLVSVSAFSARPRS